MNSPHPKPDRVPVTQIRMTSDRKRVAIRHRLDHLEHWLVISSDEDGMIAAAVATADDVAAWPLIYLAEEDMSR